MLKKTQDFLENVNILVVDIWWVSCMSVKWTKLITFFEVHVSRNNQLKSPQKTLFDSSIIFDVLLLCRHRTSSERCSTRWLVRANPAVTLTCLWQRKVSGRVCLRSWCWMAAHLSVYSCLSVLTAPSSWSLDSGTREALPFFSSHVGGVIAPPVPPRNIPHGTKLLFQESSDSLWKSDLYFWWTFKLCVKKSLMLESETQWTHNG